MLEEAAGAKGSEGIRHTVADTGWPFILKEAACLLGLESG